MPYIKLQWAMSVNTSTINIKVQLLQKATAKSIFTL